MMEDSRKIAMLQNKKLIVGIDIAKIEHYASLLGEDIKGHKRGMRVSNTQEGFADLARVLSTWNKDEVIIGMEPTGHYWKALYWYLANKDYLVVLTNPFHVKSSKELYDNHKSKSDSKDSRLIGLLVKEGKFLEHITLTGPYAELRYLSNAREQKKKELIRTRIRLVALLDEYLPEFHQNFKDVTRVSCMALLKKYGLQGLRSTEKYSQKIATLREKSKKAISEDRAKKIIGSFEQSIGVMQSITSAERNLQMFLHEMELFQIHVESLEQEMETRLRQTGEADYLLAIKGVGVVTAGIILGETGSLNNYRHSKQIEKLAGLLLSENSSGKFKGRVHISRRGRRLLRCTLFRLAVSLVCNNQEFKKLYHYKKTELKKPGRSALIAIIVKFLRVMFYVVRNNTKYDGNLIFQSLAQA